MEEKGDKSFDSLIVENGEEEYSKSFEEKEEILSLYKEEDLEKHSE